MIQSERENLIGRDPCSILVHHAKTIRVPSVARPSWALPERTPFRTSSRCSALGSGGWPPKERITIPMENSELRAGFLKQAIQIIASAPMHYIHGDLELCLFDCAEFDELFDLLKIIRL